MTDLLHQGDHIPDRLWSEQPDPRHTSHVWVCTLLGCHERCDSKTASYCVLCPLTPAHQKVNASFFYCEEHLTRNNIAGLDDREGICSAHWDTFQAAIVEATIAECDGRDLEDIARDWENRDMNVLSSAQPQMVQQEDVDEFELWYFAFSQHIRLWRWRMYGNCVNLHIHQS